MFGVKRGSREPEFVLGCTLLGRRVETRIEATMCSECRVQGQVDAIFGRKRDSKGSGSFRENGFSVCHARENELQ